MLDRNVRVAGTGGKKKGGARPTFTGESLAAALFLSASLRGWEGAKRAIALKQQMVEPASAE